MKNQKLKSIVMTILFFVCYHQSTAAASSHLIIPSWEGIGISTGQQEIARLYQGVWGDPQFAIDATAITFTIEDPFVARVDKKGVITGMAEGATLLYLKYQNQVFIMHIDVFEKEYSLPKTSRFTNNLQFLQEIIRNNRTFAG